MACFVYRSVHQEAMENVRKYETDPDISYHLLSYRDDSVSAYSDNIGNIAMAIMVAAWRGRWLSREILTVEGNTLAYLKGMLQWACAVDGYLDTGFDGKFSLQRQSKATVSITTDVDDSLSRSTEFIRENSNPYRQDLSNRVIAYQDAVTGYEESTGRRDETAQPPWKAQVAKTESCIHRTRNRQAQNLSHSANCPVTTRSQSEERASSCRRWESYSKIDG
ncbi:hypothetical protein ARMGADRAFT_1098375 [Armillaria gallica]|uniref:Uncharacterized protein n=1 Tax=Armillaria gallica TaxID=47427 RepID=A0A2H3CUM4_ARMGA|nr:hypothetical protein ARMGADRAFT_1098375 [Armillaria gallica]